MELEFEWDLNKADNNARKHGILFEDAVRIFDDPMHLSVLERFENGEHRWQTIGMVNGCAILLVVHTTTLCGMTEVIRIISARKATRKERERYEHG